MMMPIPLPLSFSVIVSLFALTLYDGQSGIQNAAVYTDRACTQLYTADTSWQSFSNLSYGEVDSTRIDSFVGPCTSSFIPRVASGQFACVVSSVERDTYNESIHTLSTQQWMSDSGCPSLPAADVRYYFSGPAGHCIPSATSHTTRLTAQSPRAVSGSLAHAL